MAPSICPCRCPHMTSCTHDFINGAVMRLQVTQIFCQWTLSLLCAERATSRQHSPSCSQATLCNFLACSCCEDMICVRDGDMWRCLPQGQEYDVDEPDDAEGETDTEISDDEEDEAEAAEDPPPPLRHGRAPALFCASLVSDSGKPR